MKKFILFLLIILPTDKIIGQVRVSVDTLTRDRIHKLELGSKKLQFINDSLNKEMIYYRSKEDLYIGLFERYSNHVDVIFASILTIVLFALPFIWYFTFSKMKKKIKKLNDTLELELKDFKYNSTKLESYMYRRTAVFNSVTSHLIGRVSKTSRVNALYAGVTAIGDIYRSVTLLMPDDANNDIDFLETILNNLIELSELLPIEDLSDENLLNINKIVKKALIFEGQNVLLKCILLYNNNKKIHSLLFNLYKYFEKIDEKIILNKIQSM